MKDEGISELHDRARGPRQRERGGPDGRAGEQIAAGHPARGAQPAELVDRDAGLPRHPHIARELTKIA